MGCELEKQSRDKEDISSIAYGCDELGRLKSVLVHTPGDELTLVNESNYKQWLYDRVPDIPEYIEEHRNYQELLESNGVKVYELTDHVEKNVELVRKCQILLFYMTLQ